MRIAFVSIPRFPCAVELLRNPRLDRAPLIVGDADEPKRVLDCSSSAARSGVRPGMPIRAALGHCPDAAVLPPDPVLYRARWQAILEALDSISPEIEDEEMGRAYVNVSGLSPHYQDDQALAAHVIEAVRSVSGLDSSVGLAGGKFPAFAAAIKAAPGCSLVVPAGGEGDFLAPLSVELLSVDQEIVFRLQLFGIDTIAEVAALSLPELQSQFGFAGRRLWQLARGIDESVLHARPRAESVRANLSFEAPVAGIDVMIAAARQLLSRL
jgi:DNA polymerase IV